MSVCLQRYPVLEQVVKVLSRRYDRLMASPAGQACPAAGPWGLLQTRIFKQCKDSVMRAAAKNTYKK
jgi:hypothetical protein